MNEKDEMYSDNLKESYDKTVETDPGKINEKEDDNE